MTTNAATIVRIDHVSKQYGDAAHRRSALDDVSVDIRAGELTAVMGARRSGRSTLMRVVAGLEPVSTGRVCVSGVDITGLTVPELRRRQLGTVFLSSKLVMRLRVVDNLFLPLRLAGQEPSRADVCWVEHLVDLFGLSDVLGHRPVHLSRAQRQRITIVRALASRPALVTADDPTGPLDALLDPGGFALLRKAVTVREQSAVIVTRDPLAAVQADRVLFLRDGRLVAVGERMDLLDIEAEMLLVDQGSRADDI